MALPHTRNGLILLVEDDASAAQRLASLLREDGYDVELLRDGAAAIARLDQQPTPDFLLVDYRLPRADGLSVAAHARSLRDAPHVVMISSYLEVVARLGRRLDPPLVMLPKPLAYDDLMRELRQAAPGTP